jgi:hypothetical protein
LCLQGAAKVSLIMVGQQTVMDAYLCLIHLTAGIVFETLFNTFATAAFFEYVTLPDLVNLAISIVCFCLLVKERKNI